MATEIIVPDKRERIMEAAKTRFGRYGIRATTMQDIARLAGVAVGTIYQFFPNKDALILAWVQKHADLLSEQLESVLAREIPADEKLREFLRLRFATIDQVRNEPAIREISRAVLRLTPETVGKMVALIIQNIEIILNEGKQTGCLPSVDPAEDAGVLFLSLGGFFISEVDPVTGPPNEAEMLRVVDWFVKKWKLSPPTSQS